MTATTRTDHAAEIARGERFEFGENWTRFLAGLNDVRIARAEDSLREMLEVETLEGCTFLDIGSGSGLFSLAARRLGATVRSLDYDPQSVACTAELRRRYFPDDVKWIVEQGSVLDDEQMRRLGSYDIVYSWGVLHHTGELWHALENASIPVPPGGRLFIAIYNDTGSQSARWARLKRTYNQLPRPLRPAFAAIVSAPQELKELIKALLAFQPQRYLATWTHYDENRGMTHWRDIVDWVGGYPYEPARVDQIFDFYRARGFTLDRLKAGRGLGCSEFVFRRLPVDPSPLAR